MRYNPTLTTLETEGFTETRQYQIAATGKAFRNLIDGLYSRKIEAVIRELSTNAYDSHRAAGQTQPFLVELPNSIRARFAVRDYGVGMTHQQIMGLYSTLFQSTKDQSDDDVGMLGLGSKSPFAYTDSFTIQCYDGEQCRTYASYLDPQGVPLISLADTQPNTEPQGVQVSFAVKLEDCTAFEVAAIKVFKGFDTLPTGLPMGVKARAELGQYLRYKGTNWSVYSDAAFNTKLQVQQGCVLYPLEITQLKLEPEFVESLRKCNLCIVFHVPIGSVSFTPGRETLEYDPTTVGNLQPIVNNFRTELDALFAKQFENCKTDFEIALQYENNKDGLLQINLFQLTAFYKTVMRVNKGVTDALPDRAKNRNNTDYFYSVSMRYETINTKFRRRNEYPRTTLFKNRPIVFIQRDSGVKDSKTRITKYLIDHNLYAAITWAEPNSSTTAPLTTPDLSKFGNPPILHTSNLPAPPTPPKARPSYIRYEVFTVNTETRSTSYTEVEENGELPEGAEYVFLYKEHVVQPLAKGQVKTWPVLQDHWSLTKDLLKRSLITQRPVVGIRMRGNECLGKWSTKRRYKKAELDLVGILTPKQVRQCINIDNYRLFQHSFYSEVLRYVRSDPELKNRYNPLTAMQRFVDRPGRIPQKELKVLELRKSFFSEADKEHLIERGRLQGLEILTEGRGCNLLDDLLPLPWENFARMVLKISTGSNRMGLKQTSLLPFVKMLEAGK